MHLLNQLETCGGCTEVARMFVGYRDNRTDCLFSVNQHHHYYIHSLMNRVRNLVHFQCPQQAPVAPGGPQGIPRPHKIYIPLRHVLSEGYNPPPAALFGHQGAAPTLPLILVLPVGADWNINWMVN